MVPTLRAGDRLIARRIACGTRPGPLTDRVVLVTWATQPGLVAIKRVLRIGPEGVFVTGDNPFATTDSTVLGPALVRAVVVARIWPWPRLIRSRGRASRA